jgi:hypothetical protein
MAVSSVISSIVSLNQLVQEQMQKINSLEKRMDELKAENEVLQDRVSQQSDIIYRHGKLIHAQNLEIKKLKEKETPSSRLSPNDIEMCFSLLFKYTNYKCHNFISAMINVNDRQNLGYILEFIRTKNPICEIMNLNEETININNCSSKPIILSISRGFVEEFRLLIEYGAEICLPSCIQALFSSNNEDGWYEKKIGMAQLLIENCENINMLVDNSHTSIHVISSRINSEIQTLFNIKVCIQQTENRIKELERNREGSAIISKRLEMQRNTLKEQKLKQKYNDKMLRLCINILRMFKEAGADMNIEGKCEKNSNYYGKTPLNIYTTYQLYSSFVQQFPEYDRTIRELLI